MSEPLGKVSAMGDERRRILLSGEPRGQKEDKAMDREKMLDVTLQQIEKQFGKGAVMKLGEHPMGAGITVIPTGSLALDIALGVGGIPRGRIIEVFGPEGSGKTTVCLHMIAEAQAKGGIAAFIDAEHALDPTYARELGVNIDELLVSQPDSGEQALEIADMLVRSAALDIVVVDSVAALVPRAEIEGEMGDTHVGLQARLMSQAMRKLAGTLSRFDTSAIFINQLREKIGVMFGSPETTPGGRALKFYSSVRLDVRKIENLKDGTDVVGSRTRVKVVKNKVAPPFRQCEFDIMYGKGISKEGSLIDVGVDLEIVKKAGAWFTYEGDQLGQGRENAQQFLAEHADVRDEIDRKVREAVGLTDFGIEGEETPDPGRARPRPRGPAPEPEPSRYRPRPAKPRRRATATASPSAMARPGSRKPKNPKSCHERALGLLAVRARSRRELERRLLQAGFEAGRGDRRSRTARASGPHRRRARSPPGRRARVRREAIGETGRGEHPDCGGGPTRCHRAALLGGRGGRGRAGGRVGGLPRRPAWVPRTGQGVLAVDIAAGQTGIQPGDGAWGGSQGPGDRWIRRGPQPCLWVHAAVASWTREEQTKNPTFDHEAL